MKLQTQFSILICAELVWGLLSCTDATFSLHAKKEALGKLIFQDTLLSEPIGQSLSLIHI